MIAILWFLSVTSLLVMLVAALGLLRLPHALSRQHAATKAATLSVSLFLLALAVHVIDSEWGWPWLLRLATLLAVLLLTLPIASHALGRSAVIEATRDNGKSF